MKRTKTFKNLCLYTIGLFIISIGINITKLTNLGISPASSLPAAISCINTNIDLGTTTQLFYIFLIVLQIAILGKKFKKRNIFGLLVAVVFGWMINLTGNNPTAIIGFFGIPICKVPFTLMSNLSIPNIWVWQLIFCLIAIVIIGFGVFLYLRPSWVPMPPEGLAEAISFRFNKKFGDCKSAVDSSIVFLALMLQIVNAYLCTGSVFDAFTNPKYIVCREGTIIAAIFVGQVVKFFYKKLPKRI